MSHDTTKISQKVTMLGAALSLLVPVAIGGCGNDNKTPTTPPIDVKIGAMLPRTGPNANSDWISAVELAVADMTAAVQMAGVKMKQPLTFTLDEQDTASDETKSHDAMITYSAEGARIVITEASNAAIGGNKWNYEQILADATSDAPMALISFTATSASLHPATASTDPIPARAAALNDGSHYFYRTCPVSNNLSAIRLNQIFTTYGDVNGDGNTYIGTPDGMAALGQGKTFVSENVSFDAGTDPATFDYTPWIAKATDNLDSSLNPDGYPDLIINKALPTIAIPFIKAYKQNPANTYAIFQDGSFRRNSLLLALTSAADGQVGVSNIAFMGGPSGATFKAEQQAQTHFPPAAYEAQGYDAMALALLAVIKASIENPNNANDPTTMTNASVRAAVGQLNDPSATALHFGAGAAEFAKAIEALQHGDPVNYDGASGNVDFDANGDTYDYATLWKIQGGQFVETAYFNCLPMQGCAAMGSMLPTQY
jgi:hypothetical protein